MHAEATAHAWETRLRYEEAAHNAFFARRKTPTSSVADATGKRGTRAVNRRPEPPADYAPEHPAD
jgi:hypothetical protein